VLLDANVIIQAYTLNVWDKLIEHVDVHVSSIVAHQEALFYLDPEKKYVPEEINLKNLIASNKIKEFSATRQSMSALLNMFDSVFAAGLHDGEIEALSLILYGEIGDTLYCSSDAKAIQALAMIGHSEKGISMETLLKKTGLQKKINRQFTEKFFKNQISLGVANLLTRKGLKR
jgi:hypothetical protein